MDELRELFRNTIDPTLKDEEINKISDFWNLLSEKDIEYDPDKMLDFIQRVFQKCEKAASEECVTYDIAFLRTHPDIVKRYKALVAEIDTDDVPTAAPLLSKLSDEFFKELLAIGNQLAIMVDTKTKGNKESLFKTFIADGYKYDADSKIIGFVKTGLYDGYKSYKDEFDSSVNGRIAGIINADVIERVGYITRKHGFLLKFTKLQQDESNLTCMPSLNVNLSKGNIKRFTGRYYLNESGTKEMITLKTPIDKTYKIFSPKGCTALGKDICPTCFGKLSNNLRHLTTLGTLAQTIMQAITQKLLSSKHFSSIILQNYSDILYNGYNKGKPSWTIKPDSKKTIDREGNLRDSEGATYPFLTRELKWIDEEKKIFEGDGNFYTKNTKSLVNLFEEIFNKTQSFDGLNDFDSYLGGMLKFDDIANLGINSILWEIILMNMCRNANDLRLIAKETPEEPYVIVSMAKAIMKSGNMDSLFFERFNEQVSSPDFFLRPLEKAGYAEFYFGNNEKGAKKK